MEEKKELNEILLGDDNNNHTSKTKKLFLMIIIAIVVILILLIVAWKMKTGTSEQTPPATVDNSIQKLDTLHDGNNPTDDMNDDFENMSIDDMSKSDQESKFDKIVNDIKSKQQLANQKEDTHLTPPAENSEDHMLPIAGQDNQKSTNPLDNHSTESIKQAPKSIKTETTKPESVKKQPAKPDDKTKKSSTKPKEVKQPVTKPALKNGSNATAGHYLQVGVFNKTPNKAFLDKIKKYSYRTQTSILNGETVTKYLIGPYKSRNEASKDIADITSNLTKPVYTQIK